MNTYSLSVAGVTRNLNKIQITPNLTIASFVMLGDTQLIEACSSFLYQKIKNLKIDYLISPEAKSIPLVHSLAVLLNLDYIVIRKSVKGYMNNPIKIKVNSITTIGEQEFVLDGVDADKIRNKRIVIVDDVVSTGGSINATKALLNQLNCNIIAECAVLLEEAGYDNKNLIYLEKLPIWRS